MIKIEGRRNGTVEKFLSILSLNKLNKYLKLFPQMNLSTLPASYFKMQNGFSLCTIAVSGIAFIGLHVLTYLTVTVIPPCYSNPQVS